MEAALIGCSYVTQSSSVHVCASVRAEECAPPLVLGEQGEIRAPTPAVGKLSSRPGSLRETASNHRNGN